MEHLKTKLGQLGEQAKEKYIFAAKSEKATEFLEAGNVMQLLEQSLQFLPKLKVGNEKNWMEHWQVLNRINPNAAASNFELSKPNLVKFFENGVKRRWEWNDDPWKSILNLLPEADFDFAQKLLETHESDFFQTLQSTLQEGSGIIMLKWLAKVNRTKYSLFLKDEETQKSIQAGIEKLKKGGYEKAATKMQEAIEKPTIEDPAENPKIPTNSILWDNFLQNPEEILNRSPRDLVRIFDSPELGEKVPGFDLLLIMNPTQRNEAIQSFNILYQSRQSKEKSRAAIEHQTAIIERRFDEIMKVLAKYERQ